MRPTMVSLSTLLLLVGGHAHAQVFGPVNQPPKSRMLGVHDARHELL